MPALVVALALFVPLGVSAHGTGASLEKSVPPYVIDIGYEPPQPIAGDRLVFDFGLVDAASSSTVPYDSVWVRLEAEKTLLATGISRPLFGPTSLLYALDPRFSGVLSLTTRFQKDGETLAEATFEIPVLQEGRELSDYSPFLASGFVGLLLGLVAAGAFMLRHRPMV